MAPQQMGDEGRECPCALSIPLATVDNIGTTQPRRRAGAGGAAGKCCCSKTLCSRRSLFACLALLLSTGLSEAFATPLGLPTPPRGGADAVMRQSPGEGGRNTKSSKSSSGGGGLFATRRTRGDASAGGSDEVDLDPSQRLEIERLEIPIPAGGGVGVGSGLLNDHFSNAPDSAGVLPVAYVAETNLPTDVGHFRLRAYRIPAAALEGGPGAVARTSAQLSDLMRGMGTEPCVIYCTDKPPFGIKGGREQGTGAEVIKPAENVPVRIHDQCFTSEVFRSQRCDCKEQLKMALEYIQENGGAIIYLQQEGRGIGLANKVAAYALQDVGMDTVDANIHLGFPEDCRQYGVVPSILEDMGIRSIRLLTNNPRKLERIRALGVEVVDTVPMVVERANRYNKKYLETKQERMNHSNFGDMLSRKLRPVTATEADIAELSASREAAAENPSVAETFINEGEEMAAAAVALALLDDNESGDGALKLEGVTAREDGYCFGRQSVEDAIAAVAKGDMVVVVDDMDRENEGDFIMAADLCTPEAMADIVRYSSGVICVGMEGERMDELKLPAMVTNNEDPKGTAFSVTVDAGKQHGITTGISAADRAITMKLLASPECTPADLCRPGHIFPLRARDGGVLGRDGHTEAAVDLCKLAGRAPAGVLCEIVSEEDPTGMARLPELRRFCIKKGYVLTSIVDLAQYRRDTEGK